MPRISAKICLGATVACLATKFGAEFAVEHFPETHTTQKLKAIVLIDENKTDERSGKPYRLLTLELVEGQVEAPPLSNVKCVPLRSHLSAVLKMKVRVGVGEGVGEAGRGVVALMHPVRPQLRSLELRSLGLLLRKMQSLLELMTHWMLTMMHLSLRLQIH